MDEYLMKSRYQHMHKARPEQKATSHAARREDLRNRRKDTRADLLAGKRNMHVEKPVKIPSNEKPSQGVQSELMERLKAWKEEKKIRIQREKAQKKPLFKVRHLEQPLGNTDLEYVNQEIKGKRFILRKTSKQFNPETTKQSNSVSHQINAPQPVEKAKPGRRKLGRQLAFDLSIEKNTGNKKVLFDKDTPSTSSNVQHTKTTTRSRTKANTKGDVEAKSKKANKTPKNKKTVQKEKSKETKSFVFSVDDIQKENILMNKPAVTPRKHRSAVDEESPTKMRRTTRILSAGKTPMKRQKKVLVELNSPGEVEQEPMEDSTEDKLVTPDKEGRTPQPAAYISPFVTISRGKNSARKEFHIRKSQGGLFDSSPELKRATGSEAACEYFHNMLDREIARIQCMCDDWNKYKEEENPPEDACDMINVAVGQSQLLINKKFKQFRGLINDCETGDAEPPITSADLHGYWDTAYIQVDNLNRRFENLDKLKMNNWEEILPVRKEETTKEKVKKVLKRRPKIKAQASSSLRELIKGKRQKANGEKVPAVAEEDVINVTTPEIAVKIATPRSAKFATPHSAKVATPRSVRSRRKNSILASVLTSEASKRISSPGLIIMRVAQTARSVEKRADSLSDGTPAKSILKSRVTKSTNKKSVLFKEDNEEGSLLPPDLFSPPSEYQGRRKSARLSQMKLF